MTDPLPFQLDKFITLMYLALHMKVPDDIPEHREQHLGVIALNATIRWELQNRPLGPITDAEADAADARKKLSEFIKEVESRSADIVKLAAELEQTRTQLAGCGVAAIENTERSIPGRAKPGDYGWSASYQDVCGAVDREIALRAELAGKEAEISAERVLVADKAIPMRLTCPECTELHIDEGEFAAKLHHTHACQRCGMVWRPAVEATVGVRFLPGFKDA